MFFFYILFDKQFVESSKNTNDDMISKNVPIYESWVIFLDIYLFFSFFSAESKLKSKSYKKAQKLFFMHLHKFHLKASML